MKSAGKVRINKGSYDRKPKVLVNGWRFLKNTPLANYNLTASSPNCHPTTPSVSKPPYYPLANQRVFYPLLPPPADLVHLRILFLPHIGKSTPGVLKVWVASPSFGGSREHFTNIIRAMGNVDNHIKISFST